MHLSFVEKNFLSNYSYGLQLPSAKNSRNFNTSAQSMINGLVFKSVLLLLLTLLLAKKHSINLQELSSMRYISSANEGSVVTVTSILTLLLKGLLREDS